MDNLNSTPIRLLPHIRDKILFIAKVLDSSIQGTANYLLDRILDEAIESIKQFEKNLDENLKSCIKQVIKERYENSKKNLR